MKQKRPNKWLRLLTFYLISCAVLIAADRWEGHKQKADHLNISQNQ